MKKRYIFWFLFGIILYLYLGLFKAALIDDAFITLNYVRTILRSGTWGYFPGYITNTATSPLNVVLLTLISWIIGPSIDAPIWLTFIAYIIIALTLTRISNILFDTEIFGYLAAWALIFNPLIISTIGLEGILFVTLFVISIYFYITKKWYSLAFVLGLLTLTRPEGVLIFGVMLIFIPSNKIKFQFAGIYLMSIAPWYIFSWIYLGSLLPDTLFIKMVQKSWGSWNFFNGPLLYYRRYPLETILSYVYFPLLVLFLNRQVRRSSILVIVLLTGIVNFVGYSLLQVPPYHWYYVPQVTTIVLLGSLGLGFIHQSYKSPSWQRKGIHVLTSICFLVPALGMFYLLSGEHFAVKEMPIHSNWGTHDQYKEIGLWLSERDNGESIFLSGEIGTLSYYCDCYILDEFSDRSLFRKNVVNQSFGQGVRSIFFKINFLFFADNPEFPPYSYRLTGNPSQEITDELVMKWKTSTNWVNNGLLYYLTIY